MRAKIEFLREGDLSYATLEVRDASPAEVHELARMLPVVATGKTVVDIKLHDPEDAQRVQQIQDHIARATRNALRRDV
jgi:hypothetical protein